MSAHPTEHFICLLRLPLRRHLPVWCPSKDLASQRKLFLSEPGIKLGLRSSALVKAKSNVKRSGVKR